jgi:hypothetical protein
MVSSQPRQPSPFLPVIYPQPMGSAVRETERRHREKVLQGERSGVGGMCARSRAPRMAGEFYTETMAWVHGATHRTRLEGVGGVSGQRCALSLGVWTVASVAH